MLMSFKCVGRMVVRRHVESYRDERGRLLTTAALSTLKNQGENHHPCNDHASYLSLLRQCGKAKASLASRLWDCINAHNLSEGRKIHEQIVKDGHAKDRFLSNLLLQMYGNCGALQEAKIVFGNMRRKNLFTWNIMVAACVHCGNLQSALKIFDEMPVRNLISWNTLIVAYAKRGQLQNALNLFRRMDKEDMKANEITYSSLIETCSNCGALEEGRALHDHLLRNGFGSDVFLSTTLINMYGKCKSLSDAAKAFEAMSQRDVVSWTTMIAAYAHSGDLEGAEKAFNGMPYRDMVAWNAMLAAYAECKSLDGAQNFFDKMPQKDMVSWNTMITVYAEHGNLEHMYLIFRQMPKRNVVSWNAILAAHAKCGQLGQAMQLFQQMQAEGMAPDEVTYSTLLNACENHAALFEGDPMYDHVIIESLDEGRKIHNCLVSNGFESNVVVSTALINMYGRCGILESAQEVFDKMPERDAVAWNAMIVAYSRCGNLHGAERTFNEMPVVDVLSWNAIIGAYAQHGIVKKVLDGFFGMQVQGMLPDRVTFVSLLSACSHAGMLDHGLHCFACSTDYGITPFFGHYECIIDLVGRAGHLDNAEDLVDGVPFDASILSWVTLLGACKKFADVQGGKRAAQNVFALNPSNLL